MRLDEGVYSLLYSAGVCMVAFARFCVWLASFCVACGESVGYGSAGGLSSKGLWRW